MGTTTPVSGWRIPSPSDPDNVPGDMQQLALDIEGGLPYRCTTFTRPTGMTQGFLAWETDRKRLLEWDGSAWRIVSQATSYFRMGRAATQAVVADGMTRVEFDFEQDPFNVCVTGAAAAMTVPRTGLLAFSWGVVFQITAGAATATSVASVLFAGGVEIRRGGHIATSAGAGFGFGSTGSAACALTAGDVVHVDVSFSSPGNSKQLAGGITGTYLEGYYVSQEA